MLENKVNLYKCYHYSINNVLYVIKSITSIPNNIKDSLFKKITNIDDTYINNYLYLDNLLYDSVNSKYKDNLELNIIQMIKNFFLNLNLISKYLSPSMIKYIKLNKHYYYRFYYLNYLQNNIVNLKYKLL
jgi:hypothetical protein